jgi:hypothetical protein
MSGGEQLDAATLRSARAQLEHDGFCVIDGVIPAELCGRVQAEVERFLGIDLDQPATWARVPPDNDGIVPLHHTQAQWDLRQHPRLHRAFAALWATERLWVSCDRATFRRPSTEAELATDVTLHLDQAPDAKQRVLQGMLYLHDTPVAQAPTAVAPALFHALDEILENGRMDRASLSIVTKPDEVLRLAGGVGTLVVWDGHMPHGPAHNATSRPRVSQAVTMFPPETFGGDAVTGTELFRSKQVIELWRGLVGQVHPEPGEPAALTALGRRLVGFDPW